MSRNLISRILVAAVCIPIILWICYQGGLWLLGMVALFALLGMAEFLWAEGFRLSDTLFWLPLLAVGLVLYLVFQGGQLGDHIDPTGWYGSVVGLVLPLLFILTALYSSVGRHSPDELFSRHSRLMWGTAYIAFLYPLVYLLGEIGTGAGPGMPSGGDSLLFLFALLWIGDTAAMGIGSALGRHKLAPAVSPNKTIEGFVGGIIGALAVGVAFSFWKFSAVPWPHVLVISLGCSVFGQLGDLVESMWKRSIGIKDSSGIIPGHGGVLDRFDSLLFAAPFMWVYFQMVL